MPRAMQFLMLWFCHMRCWRVVVVVVLPSAILACCARCVCVSSPFNSSHSMCRGVRWGKLRVCVGLSYLPPLSSVACRCLHLGYTTYNRIVVLVCVYVLWCTLRPCDIAWAEMVGLCHVLRCFGVVCCLCSSHLIPCGAVMYHFHDMV